MTSTSESLLAVLARAEAALPKLLFEPGWNTLDVDYHPPRVERAWRPFEERYRLFLHCIHSCQLEEALFHPHPWPSAMRVLWGKYRMMVGSGSTVEPPPVVLDSVVTANQSADYRYSMEHPDGWHVVVPVRHPVFTVMVTGPPWRRPIPSVTEDAKVDLKPLTPQRTGWLLAAFHRWYAE